jgi:hypothetical protein
MERNLPEREKISAPCIFDIGWFHCDMDSNFGKVFPSTEHNGSLMMFSEDSSSLPIWRHFEWSGVLLGLDAEDGS